MRSFLYSTQKLAVLFWTSVLFVLPANSLARQFPGKLLFSTEALRESLIPTKTAIFSSAMLSEPPLQLKTGWTSIKFIHNNQEPQSAFGFFSMTHNFKQILAKHPAALEVGEKANGFRALHAGGSLIMLAGAIKLLLDSANSDFADESDGSLSLGLVLSGGVLNLIGRSQVNKLSKKAVQIFNEEEAKVASR